MTISLQVPFFDYQAVCRDDEDDLVRILRDVARRGAFILGEDVARFEAELATYTGSKFAIGVNSATDALHLGLVAGGVAPGDEVIICSHTMQATAAAVHAAGATPVPIEVGPDRCMDPTAIEPAITRKTRAVMPTNLNGRTADMDTIQAVCEQHRLLLFEDAAQALGARFGRRAAGTFGVTSAISFYPAKTLGCLGDGGAILTSDPDVYRRGLLLRSFGMDATGECHLWALNSRLDNLQAAFLRHRLSKYDRVIERRRAIASLYASRLSLLPELSLPPEPSVDGKWFDVYQNYEIEAEHRDELRIRLREEGIGTLVQWNGRPVHQQRKLGFTQHLPRTDRFFGRCLMLPLNMTIADAQVHVVCDAIEAFYRGR